MTDRGFLHDVALHHGVATIMRVEEEDGNPAEDGEEIARISAPFIPDFDPDAEASSWYFETDLDLPTWLYAWADPIIDASKDTDTYRAHAAEWIGPDGDWT